MEYEEAVEETVGTDGNGVKGEDEDELLKSSIAMLDDELDQNKSALQSLIKGSINGNHETKPAEKKGRGRPRKNPGYEINFFILSLLSLPLSRFITFFQINTRTSRMKS